jgi:hypothetical protein
MPPRKIMDKFNGDDIPKKKKKTSHERQLDALITDPMDTSAHRMKNIIANSGEPTSARSRLKALKDGGVNTAGVKRNEEGNIVLEEYPLPPECVAQWKKLVAQRDKTKIEVSKMSHIQEGFWAGVREQLDSYGNNMHIEEMDNGEIMVQVIELEDEDEE